ncbi:MarR family transcriptional regulator [Bifidobacterium dolichotidis]|uniref:MarR family transcriptional regulator n=1 Tax=Bifidobacterium dolichotidis TaxID=2306976 RepID=A0A430FTH7_9BIFI|nr:DUF488 family protein [Bifidobacterium dolichotidis]RSX56179.1 MarR family transcriptional regulator [Bifidobacterium dolichotidis]
MAEATAHELRIKRIYEQEEPDDGFRVLIDRLWPRGISKDRADLDEWDKEQVAPSSDLRKWFGHDPEKFPEFEERFWNELDERDDAQAFAQEIADHLKTGNVTLLFGAKDTEHNNAVALKTWLERQWAK